MLKNDIIWILKIKYHTHLVRTMGRTQRRRKVKKTQNFQTCNNCENLILLNSWLSKKGIRRSKKLVLALFSDCNRGVLTKKKIKAGEEIINLPLNLTINVTTVLMDEAFCALFLDNDKNCLLEYKQSVTFQSLIAFYLLFLKVQGEDSKWHLYLESLPKAYTIPYFLPNEVKNFLDPDILSTIEKQKVVIDKAFSTFYDILNSTKSNLKSVKQLIEHFNRSDFEWAYFTVNTRCVFMDLSNLINLTNKQSTILNIINDNTKISLCPYLDMINHSAHARNETKLIVNKELENVPLLKLKENVFSEVRFSIYTKTSFEAYSQVFICYGDSYNLKLITEYGFYLPLNSLDYVPFNYEYFITFLHSIEMKLSQEQYNFIASHGLNKDLYIDLKGFSFNLYGLLVVAKHFYNKDVNVSKLLYSAATCSYDRDLIDFVKPILYKKLLDTEYIVSKLRKFEECVALNNCIELMCQYIRILDKFIKR